jgi:predicted AAA+ superfamily ATPase
MRSGSILNYADLARDADLSPVKAKKYLRYLALSYQSFLLPALRRRSKERLIKAPKLHWTDVGVQRVLSGLRSGLTGQQFETLIVSEIHKLCHTLRLDVELTHLRTKDGREVDLLTKQRAGAGFLALEMKAGQRCAPVDARNMKGLEPYLDGPLIAGIVVYQGQEIQVWDDALFAVPAHVLFGERGG